MFSARNKLGAFVALLLAALTLGGTVELGHDHAPLATTAGHGELPVFEPSCDAEDHRGHLESATEVESSDCVACLLRQRARGLTAQAPKVVGHSPSARAIIGDAGGRPVAGSADLPPARAPPRA